MNRSVSFGPKIQEPSKFTVHEPFMGTVTVQMNETFRRLLSNFIDEVDAASKVEPELWAFRKALENPAESKLKYETKRNSFKNGAFRNESTY